MDFLFHAFARALHLITSFDAGLVEIVSLSLRVSVLAVILSALTGIGLTLFLELFEFPLKKFIVSIINTLMGLPPVVAGLVLYLILSRSGPLGFLGLLYSPAAMVIVQVILATPIVTGLSYAALVSADPSLKFTARTLGATRLQASVKVMKDVRYAIIAAVLAGFGRVIAEVGAVLIVGGNIAGYTRVMTTAIALEADKGDFELAIALGIILLILSFVVNGTLTLFQKRSPVR